MTAEPLPAVVLQGHGVRLEPLATRHLPALHTALADPAVFAGGWGGGAAALTPDLAGDPEAFGRWLLRYLPAERAVSYAVVHGDEVVGTTTLGHLDPATESLHVGWTAYAPRVWGTGVNAACKLLVLGHAFGCGYGRVQLQADARNDRSRAAIVRLGAEFEGVLRRTQPRADGSWRDTAVYSVLREEWPRVRAGLLARLR
ncbi:GNAT family N-acetyltransferase [Serinibacter salmoneus]|uniref:RimJ/RimL family protein N-acetyltransferase n=1 Tax=Serinibacter salmoneus TaxID=556530 RepID=A0A2A9CXC8_9MICO|nr:GNAT family protein [Serinibacter salmoneus]PFG18665.1 RimJ/RimL family protein N-acetyltransferase [Serinibacter salmoneus]